MSIRRNTLLTLSSSVAPLLLTLLTLPVYLGLIGTERYGVLAIAFILIGYFNIFNLGIGPAVSQRIAGLAHAEPAARSDAFWAATWVSLGLGAVGALVMIPASWFIFRGFVVLEPALQSEAVSAAPWLAAAVPALIISQTAEGVLQARERFFELSLIRVLGAFLLQLVPLGIAAAISVDLCWLVGGAVLGRGAVALLLIWQAALHAPSGPPRAPDRAAIVELLSFGGWVTLSGITSTILITLDQIAISRVLGAAAVAFYAIPMNLVGRIGLISFSLTQALYPRLSAISDPVMRAALAERGMLVLAAVITPVMIAAAMLAPDFLRFWIDDAFAQKAGSVALVLIPGFWANAIAAIAFTVLRSARRPDLIAKVLLAELLPYCGVLAVMLSEYGIIGAAITWSCRAVGDAVVLCKLARVGQGQLFITLVQPFLLVVTAMAIALADISMPLLSYICEMVLFLVGLIWAIRILPVDVGRTLPFISRFY